MDTLDAARKAMTETLNAEAGERAALEARYGHVWNTEELSRDFDVVGFAAPFCVVRRKSDGREGALAFQHRPRYYFDFRPS